MRKRSLRKTYHPKRFGEKNFSLGRAWNKLLKLLPGFVLASVFLLSAVGTCMAEMPLGELVAKIQENYEGAADLKAGFVQESKLKTTGRTEREEGTVYFKKPKKMLWDYSRPQAKKLVINARTAWLYVPEDKMVYVQDSKNVFSSGQAIRFLAGIGKLKEDFKISYAKPQQDSAGRYLLEMVPKGGPQSAGGAQKLLATVDPDTFFIIGCNFKDGFGNTTTIRFHDIKTNNGLADSLFTFKPPPGVEVQKMQ